MIANSVLILAIWGALGSILVSPKSNKIVSLLSFIITSVIFFFLSDNYLAGVKQNFSFEWLKYMSLQVDIDLSSTSANYAQILPVYVISLFSILIAIFNTEEKRKQRFCCLVILNLCAVSGAVCAVNLLQLLICSCLMTVLGFCIIDDMDARKKYAFYNLLADLSLFSVCSLTYGYVGSLDFKSLPMFDKLGSHRDLVAILLAFSICLKIGLFMFHNQLYDLSVLHFNRLSYLLFCSTPLAGLIILHKFYPLTSVSVYARPLLEVLSILTICCGIYSALIIDNIKEKAVGLAQVLFGFGLVAFLFLSTNFEKVENIILLGGYLCCLILFAIYYASSYELNVSKMGGFFSGIKFGFVLICVALFSLLHYMMLTFAPANYILSIIFSALLILIAAHVFRQIFFGQSHADERVLAMLKNPAWYLILAMVAISFLFWQEKYFDYSKELVGFGGLFVLLLIIYPLRKIESLYSKELLQESDVFEDVFDFLIITPLTILGRILWLLVDFILIERTIINSLSDAIGLLIRGVSKFNIFSSWLYLFYVIMSFGLIAFLGYMGNK